MRTQRCLSSLSGLLVIACLAACTNLPAPPPRDSQASTPNTWEELWQTRNQRGPLEGARLGAQILAETTNRAHRRALVEHIWIDLNRCRPAALRQELASAPRGDWRGWLNLALAAARVTDNPAAQAARLAQWRQRHPRHPLANALPGGLERLANLAAAYPRNIALLLPLSGESANSGQAVLDGFLATDFLARERGWPALDIEVLDSTLFDNANLAYRAAAATGAGLVIGPLAAERFDTLPNGGGAATPLLILDWLTKDGEPSPSAPTLVDSILPPIFEPTRREPAGPWQLSLDTQGETRQLTELAFHHGARRALVVRPRGGWGEGRAALLLEHWRALGGSVAAVATYSGQDDYSSSLQGALNLTASERRAGRIRSIMGRSGQQVSFSPRRRQDFDVVFLLADNPRHARSIKPLLAFHYAGDLPVYANSGVLSGRVDPQRDKDINGVFTLAWPWALDRDQPLPTRIREAGGDPLLSTWHALGADAYLLGWRMAQLAATDSGRVRGQSGLLRMGRDGRLHRELTPAVMRQGAPEAL